MAPPPSKAAAAAPPPRARAAVLAGKLTQRASRRLGRGGTALPGLVAARIDGALVDRLASQLNAAILVTGTNGKTTTARMLATILESSGRVVVHNRAGSNLMRGIAAALIDAAGPSGTLPANAVGVFETDEATLPQAAAAVRPTALVIGNLSRDQLDRYGEIEAVRGQWLETIARLPATTTVVLNADDPSVSTLARAAAGPVVQFGIQDPDIAEASPAHGPALDALWDQETGAEYQYERRYLAHLGHWFCPQPSPTSSSQPIPARPTPDFAANDVDLNDPVGVAFRLDAAGAHVPVRTTLRGAYNVYNALAAATAAAQLSVPLADAASALAHTQAAFGRQEELIVDGHTVRILLGKNPVGVNAALRTLTSDGPHHLLVLLNDGLADGTDVSWIWDTDWELLHNAASVVVGGRRAADMALRLQYAGCPAPLALEPSIDAALRRRLETLPNDAPLIVLPTYTAMLEVREQLARMAGAPRIWEGA